MYVAVGTTQIIESEVDIFCITATHGKLKVR
jgi:hypothetical protein